MRRGDFLKRKSINNEIDLILKPIIINKVNNESSCEIQKIMTHKRCSLKLESIGTKLLDEWIALSRGDFVFISEKFSSYEINCDNQTSRLEFAIGIISANECRVESPTRIVQTNANVASSGHGFNYHIPINAFEAIPPPENFTKITTTTEKILDLSLNVETGVMDNLSKMLNEEHSVKGYKWVTIILIITSVLGFVILIGLKVKLRYFVKTNEGVFGDLG